MACQMRSAVAAMSTRCAYPRLFTRALCHPNATVRKREQPHTVETVHAPIANLLPTAIFLVTCHTVALRILLDYANPLSGLAPE